MFYGAQKNRHIDTGLLGTHNVCFGWEIRFFFFWYALLTKDMNTVLIWALSFISFEYRSNFKIILFENVALCTI